MTTSSGPAFRFLFLCVLGALVQSSLATTYKLTWSIPSSTTFYEDWASSKTFFVGDVLEFDYNFGAHDLLMVMPKDASTCDTSNPLQTWSAGSPTVTLDTAGTISFVCGFPNHCSLGMKLTVTVEATTPAPAPSPPAPELPPPSPVTPTPTPPKRAPVPPTEAPPQAPPPPRRRSSPAPSSSSSSPSSSPAPAPAPVVRAPARSRNPRTAPAPAPAPAKETSGASAVRSTAAIAFFATLLVSFSAFLL